MNLTEDKKMLGKQQNITGIIGKNGKSTIAKIIRHCYLGLEIDNKLASATEFVDKISEESDEKNVKGAIIEVSSCDIQRKKASYIDFDSLIFTNSSTDASPDEKWTMMRPFIALPLEKTAIINIDDAHGHDFRDITTAKTVTYALTEPASINARNIKLFIDKTEFDLYHNDGLVGQIETPYFGIYNIHNTMAAVAHFIGEGYNPKRIALLLKNLPQIKGNFHTFTTDRGVKIVADNACTPEAVNVVLTSLATVAQGKIITVIGADDNTSTKERAAIGKNALAHSTQVVFTKDNNADTKEPQSIIYDLIKNSIKQNYRICIDREKAIEIALKMAKPGDVVILFGKSHENTNAFCDETIAKYLVQKFEI